MWTWIARRHTSLCSWSDLREPTRMIQHFGWIALPDGLLSPVSQLSYLDTISKGRVAVPAVVHPANRHDCYSPGAARNLRECLPDGLISFVSRHLTLLLWSWTSM
jgi:hypothetical protein